MKDERDNISSKDYGETASFSDFIMSPFNRCLILVSGLLLLIEFSVFKYFYPHAAFIVGDSYSYINSAFYNLSVDFYPIGYPKFLRLFSVFFTTDFSLVVFQYFFVQISTLCMVFSFDYFYRLKQYLKLLLVTLLTINPAILYLSNYVSSDSLFLGLSVCWFTSLVWIINQPTWRLIFVHAVVLLLLFMVRYNSIFYPVVSVVGFLLFKGGYKIKLLGFCLILLFIGTFMIFTSHQYKFRTGVSQFSAFSGWQMANNGMYAYLFSDRKKWKALPARFNDLDEEVKKYFDSSESKFRIAPDVMLDVNAGYMWTPSSPLRIYMEKGHLNDSMSEFKKWSLVAPLYRDYGLTLMRTYPRQFVERYILPNSVRFYAPPVEFLETYGHRMDTINAYTRMWFGYKDFKLKNRLNDVNVRTLNYYPIICAVMNSVYIMLSISFFILRGRKLDERLFRLWIMFTIFWVLNLLFSVFASPVALRFQLFPLSLSTISNFILLDFMLRSEQIKPKVERFAIVD